ncbi:MAG TPA: asparaginase [Candidatus Corynebacterium gallistercoris]|uniref:asparaginase n=1 Tax=Candidatus Corynebacterium gallistercoris TaxID=2838530 RepID=A0A9D1S1F7_9CORY|nr:asparaginase [Candidatus Corynebacterium gallistercoris]
MTLPIRVLGTGGTISCTHDASGHLVPTLNTADLLAQAGFAGQLGATLVADDVMSIDSSSVTLSQLDELLGHISRAREGSAAVVVLHGTDTMEETLMAVDLRFGADVPVIFTGAQRPADDPSPDGPGNIAGAVELAQKLYDQSGGGAWLHFGGEDLPARGAYKAHTTADAPFRSAVAGGGDDPTPVICGDSVGRSGTLAGLRVPIVATYSGDDGSLVRFATSQPIDGLVIEALGSGNVPQPVAEALGELATRRPEVPVVISTRVVEGGVAAIYGGAGGGASLAALGTGAWATGGSLRPSQLRMALLHRLAVQKES